jgi:SAM-dependent methyltransferase
VAGRDPRERFTDRVADYARARPSYPPAVLDLIVRETGLRPGADVVDVGAGTGILTALLLDRGFRVVAVEPNRAMAAAAEGALGTRPGYRGVAGSAEETTLDEASADLVVAAQAFHWFDPARAGAELRRILRPPRWAAVLWNMRRTTGSAFLEGYEALLQRWGIDYREVHARHAAPGPLETFFGTTPERRVIAGHRQELDRAALRARLLSSSYTPAEGHPDRSPMLAALDDVFDAHEDDGRVTLEYETEVYLGRLA